MLVPSSVLFILGRGEPMVEHRAYLSSAGLFLTWGTALRYAVGARATGGGYCVALAGIVFLAQLGFQTIIRNMVWQDPVVLSRGGAKCSRRITGCRESWSPRRCGRTVAAAKPYPNTARPSPFDRSTSSHTPGYPRVSSKHAASQRPRRHSGSSTP